MADRLSVDTSFLIDLQRERLSGDTDGQAHRFLRDAPDVELCLSVVASGEFAEGFASTEHPIVRTVREHHVLLPVDEETALLYPGVAKDLRSRGILIGAIDLWIACSSLRTVSPC